jgi:hypothetical protein
LLEELEEQQCRKQVTVLMEFTVYTQHSYAHIEIQEMSMLKITGAGLI